MYIQGICISTVVFAVAPVPVVCPVVPELKKFPVYVLGTTVPPINPLSLRAVPSATVKVPVV